MEEGEEFGKDFGLRDCLQCIPDKYFQWSSHLKCVSVCKPTVLFSIQ
jgi:hypothetical protein